MVKIIMQLSPKVKIQFKNITGTHLHKTNPINGNHACNTCSRGLNFFQHEGKQSRYPPYQVIVRMMIEDA